MNMYNPRRQRRSTDTCQIAGGLKPNRSEAASSAVIPKKNGRSYVRSGRRFDSLDGFSVTVVTWSVMSPSTSASEAGGRENYWVSENTT